MKKKLSSLYCNFVPCKSFVSNFFIVEKNFCVLWKFFIFGGKSLRDFSLYYFRRQKLSRKWAKIEKTAKVSAPKVVISRWHFRNTFFSEPLLVVVCNSSEINISSSLWLISYTKNFKELSWVLQNSRLHSVAAIERRTIVFWEIAFSKKS